MECETQQESNVRVRPLVFFTLNNRKNCRWNGKSTLYWHAVVFSINN